MRVSTFLAKLTAARKRCAAEITANGASGNMYSRGLSNEGWAGGYQAALDDVEALLIHGHPRDDRRYWKVEK